MDDNMSYKTSNAEFASEEQMSIHNTDNATQNNIGSIVPKKPARKILNIIGKIIKVLLIILLCYLLMISTPLLLGLINTALREEPTSSLTSISIVISFCLAFAIISLSTKRYQQLSQIITPQLNGKMLMYSIVGAISLAMLLMAIVIVTTMIAQLVSCEGSSCAAWTVVSFASYPVMSFAALLIISIVKIIKINKCIALLIQPN